MKTQLFIEQLEDRLTPTSTMQSVSFATSTELPINTGIAAMPGSMILNETATLQIAGKAPQVATAGGAFNVCIVFPIETCTIAIETSLTFAFPKRGQSQNGAATMATLMFAIGNNDALATPPPGVYFENSTVGQYAHNAGGKSTAMAQHCSICVTVNLLAKNNDGTIVFQQSQVITFYRQH